MKSPAGSTQLIRFGDFELDPHTRELRTHGQMLSLQEQPFQILLALVEHPGQLVTRDELTKRLWPSRTFVDFDHSLNTAVNRLRGALADSAEQPRFIESLPRRGYRFIAEVTLDDPTKPHPLPDQGAVFGDNTELRQAAFAASTPIGRTPGVHHRRRVVIVAALVFAVSAGLVTAIVYLRRSPRPMEKHSIVLADFNNTTGDSIFEGTLRQGLAAQLEQSPFLDVVSDEQVAQILQMMGQPRDAKLTAPLANEICRRTGSLAWLDGSVANLDGEYVLGLRAMNCESNRTLARVQVTAGERKQVLKALGKAATQLRTELGESARTTLKFDTPLDQATTPSLEALQAYSLGRRALWGGENATAVLLFRRATQLDPNFALAYASLGMSYMNLGQTTLAAENTKKAYDLRAQVSEREKLYIESHYQENVVGDLEKSRQIYELWAQTYPNDFVPADNLAGIYEQLGQYEGLLALDLKAFGVDPANASTYGDRVADYTYLNRLGEAQATAEAAFSKNIDIPKLHSRLYVLAFLRNDRAGMAQQVALSAGKPAVEDLLLALEAETAAYGGRLSKAREFSQQAVMAAKSLGESETEASYEAFSALRESLIGNPLQVRPLIAAALRLSTGRDVQAVAALTLAFNGDLVRSQALANDLARRFPGDTMVQINYLPTIRAQLALAGHDPKKAIETAKAGATYELGDPVDNTITLAMYLIYVRGQAYLAAGEGHQSATEFQKILEHPGVVQNKPIGALAYLGLARAYRIQGDVARARAKYQDFLALWQEADPGIPVLKQARAEYAKLQ